MVCLGNQVSLAAEDEITLFLDDGRIGLDESLPADSSATELIEHYYHRIPAAKGERLLVLRQRLAGLMPDYEVAFTAADTAEVNSILSAVTRHWSAILGLHDELFTPDLALLLRDAYGQLYPLVAID
ncbi:MAG: hypothetical protein MRY76_00120 [Pseudomonadales bacterium]|nr:hypothetical protein [Pseudomonadales bacterium]